MDITIKSLKFDADEKLIAFVEKKVSKLAKFNCEQQEVEVTLSLCHQVDGKSVRIKVHTPGENHLIERNSTSFEDAVNKATDAMKERLTRSKEDGMRRRSVGNPA